EKSSFSIDQELFDSFRNALRKKIFNNGELVGFKIYEHSYDHFLKIPILSHFHPYIILNIPNTYSST
ncbi:MAG: hypothetical protein Q8838_02590, partial [Candidatus Phytoplasma australasiaticum]|nr:hypothetical protein [Candidatus Phytoplasma australasiaticum]